MEKLTMGQAEELALRVQLTAARAELKAVGTADAKARVEALSRRHRGLVAAMADPPS